MIIEQLYTKCLSEAAYFIVSDGEAAVIDPLRDIDIYIEKAKQNNATIKYIFETHFHADFVSGHLDLAKKTGAKIIFGPEAITHFEKYTASDNEEFELGKIKIKAIHTPGHTIESTSYLLFDENNQQHALFSGDTLFVGEVGRPDLLSGNMTKEELASMMYDSLQKIKMLPNHIIVYPAHGPGSSCGKNIGPNTMSTIGDEIKTNYALQFQSKKTFVENLIKEIPPPPPYFFINAAINKEGYENIDYVIANGMKALSVADFKKRIEDDVIILDTRPALTFTHGFIPNSINIGLEGRFAEWAGTLLPFDKKIILVTEVGKENETIVRMARVGFENIIGYLKDGFDTWKKAKEKIDLIIDIEPDELKMDMNYDKNMLIVDVRTNVEFESGHVKSAVNIPLQSMTDVAVLSNIEEQNNVYIHCAGGYRSVIASSILKRQGFHNIRNVLGGYEKIKEIPAMHLSIPKAILN